MTACFRPNKWKASQSPFGAVLEAGSAFEDWSVATLAASQQIADLLAVAHGKGQR